MWSVQTELECFNPDMRVLSVKLVLPTKEQRPFEYDIFFHVVKPYPNPPPLIVYFKKRYNVVEISVLLSDD